MIKLHAIKAELSAADGGWSRMEAMRGVFDSKVERLVMQDKITIATSTGVTGELKHASLDTKNQILRSHRPVSFVLPNGTVRANALTLQSAEHTLTFRGKVAVHMVKKAKEEKKAPEAEAKTAPAAAADAAKERGLSLRARAPCRRAPNEQLPAPLLHCRGPRSCAAVSLALALLFAAPLAAQTLTNAFGGLTESSKEPIDIESDVLVVHDKEKYATFKGNVKAVQGTTTLRAKELNVHYVGGDKLSPGAKKEGGEQAAPATKVADAQGGAAAPASENGTQITKIEAKGDVVITSDKDQTTTSDWALYDLPSQLVTVGGNVVLTQGKNVLKGDRLVIDLKTGESRFENSGNAAAGGRIRALFMPKQEGAKTAKSSDAKPGETKSGGATAEDAAPSGDKPDAAIDETPADSEPSDDVPWPLTPDTQP